MPVTPSYREFILDQLERVGPVRAKSMFGGVGVYSGDLFFALIADDVLYFKVDNGNQPDYEAKGMEAFRPFSDRPYAMSYYEVPADVLEDAEELGLWVEKALEAALTARKGK